MHMYHTRSFNSNKSRSIWSYLILNSSRAEINLLSPFVKLCWKNDMAQYMYIKESKIFCLSEKNIISIIKNEN